MPECSRKGKISVILLLSAFLIEGCGSSSSPVSAPSISTKTAPSSVSTPIDSFSPTNNLDTVGPALFMADNSIDYLNSSLSINLIPKSLSLFDPPPGTILFTTNVLPDVYVIIYRSTGDFEKDHSARPYLADLQSVAVATGQEMGSIGFRCANLWIGFPSDMKQQVSDAVGALGHNLGIGCA